jgi:hypothetical protein
MVSGHITSGYFFKTFDGGREVLEYIVACRAVATQRQRVGRICQDHFWEMAL